MTEKKIAAIEQVKIDSRYLRGGITEGLADPITGAISEDDNKLLKFHGSYQQDDRDQREERRKQKLEPAFSFMIRARLPGGVVTPAQWLAFDQIACDWAQFGLRITTRQTFQWHGVRKPFLKPTLQAINKAMSTTLATCGDVNRQVVSATNPLLSEQHGLVQEWADKISETFLPKTRAYAEIWLDGKKVEDAIDGEDFEPIYGKTYLPRKFKIGIAVPPLNDVDVFAQDIGLIAIIENNQLLGFNVAIGGGMGATHGDDTTYPRLGSVIGFVRPEQLLAVCEAVITTQRDHGNRDERRHARLKYTVDKLGADWFLEEVQNRSGQTLEPSRPYHFDHNGDRFGWTQGSNGRWHLSLRIDSGRIMDTEVGPWLTGMREIAKIHQGQFRLTCNQNLIIADVPEEDKAKIDKLVADHKLDVYQTQSGIRSSTIACVSLPTCGLAMAESERYAPILLPKLETLLDKYQLRNERIVLRISGCPNGCARPYLGEIALVGRALGRYDLRLGANFSGERLNVIYRQNIAEPEILSILDELFGRFAAERLEGEHFGDFLVRAGVVAEPSSRLIPLVLQPA
ncbi:assimilatory sulfite reductase (NADPH) hemoprotein subunit [Alcaligenes faecalis]|uniref:assimilatory sulfite reductase (NADPH) hemoprotein subunit n=1 Tax=Alcaligenes faecalis TaxID=511 RepID=UPI000A2D1C58|nr:assimilatory sulfite reductase (NADPH) hemoprotein subunit [Alcaligenes faecalis]OSZ42128.1 sulfite reductase subunit beta [Alcaligenes faecalis]OSZ48076.1 sulfite reductase subunit beta [Alcaligenes faecalis]OSZ49638.1 sulfite reductase subunit beta [Alcaligenes faecalis]WHQ42383.1 assimilatory sulfite reductase (NADPH) hemoprotein subunit [Alcaligenes faecalis]